MTPGPPRFAGSFRPGAPLGPGLSQMASGGRSGPRTTLGGGYFLVGPLKWEHHFFDLFKGKIWNKSKWGLAEK